jgi:kinesin family protein 18/19
MEYLYNKFEEDKDEYDYHVEVSLVEIYNEHIIDLLADENIIQPKTGLKLLENEKNRVSIAGVTLKRPKTVDEVMDLVRTGNARRATSFTHSNAVSSRSHAVLQVNIGRVSKGTEVDFAQQVVRQCVSSATLSIIDLAGSERAAATQNIGARMQEGAKINKSLLALASCISALCEKPGRGPKPFVPFRNSQLTRLLKFSLAGNCRTVMIVCISPSSKDLEDTHNTLQWANRAKDISTKVTRNTEGVTVRIQQYLDRIAAQEQQIRELMAERNTRPKQTESAAVVQRRERDREEVRQALDGLDAEVDAHRAVISEGAEKRALWDVSQLTVTALLQRIQDLQTEINTRGAALVERDTAYLRSRVDDEKSKFHGNTHVLRMVQREVQRTKTIEKHIENVSSRSFDDLPKIESEGLKIALDMKRCQVDLGVYAAREKGYRAMHRHHANMSAITQHHIYSQKESLTTMMEAMLAAGGTAASFVSQLLIEIERSETVLSTAHGHLAPITDALPYHLHLLLKDRPPCRSHLDTICYRLVNINRCRLYLGSHRPLPAPRSQVMMPALSPCLYSRVLRSTRR